MRTIIRCCCVCKQYLGYVMDESGKGEPVVSHGYCDACHQEELLRYGVVKRMCCVVCGGEVDGWHEGKRMCIECVTELKSVREGGGNEC